MKKYIVARSLPVVVAVAFTAAACGGGSGDMEYETSSGRIDISSGDAKVKSEDPVREGRIESGSTIVLESGSRICTNTHKVGQTFAADVKNAVTGSNGAVIPAGADAEVRITMLRRRENMGDRAEMGFAVQSITVGGREYALDSRITNVEVEQVRSTGNNDVQKVVGGAIVGAVVGQILGKDTKSTVIGAATGAAAGTIVAMAGGNYEGCIPEAGDLTIALNAPVVIPVR